MKPLRMRPASVDDHDRIVALQVRNRAVTESKQDWTRLWRDNPAYRQQEVRLPIGWVLETQDGELVGWVGNIPSAYHFKGQRLQAVTPHSWIVDPRYRGRGILTLSQLMKQKNVDLIMCTGVSARSEHFADYFEVSRVPVGTWNRSSFWITNYQGFSEAALRMRSVPFAGVASYPMAAVLRGWDWRGKSIHSGATSGTGVEVCTSFDERFDDFWEDLLRQNHNVLLADRSRETLAWHFANAPLGQKLWILTSSQGSRITAYAIFDRQDNPSIGLQRIRLVDFQARKGSEEALSASLDWMLRKCRADGTHVLEVDGCWLQRAGMPRIRAPFRRSVRSWTFYYKACRSELAEMLKDPQAWAPSSYDGDQSL